MYTYSDVVELGRAQTVIMSASGKDTSCEDGNPMSCPTPDEFDE
jgi:hypothetical protein